MATSDRFLICSAFADGPYWPSVLEILGPPAGCSFYRPYNYRRQWVEAALDQDLADGETHVLQAVMGMRFRRPSGVDVGAASAEHFRFVPLRLAEAQVRRDDATVEVHLRLLAYVPRDPSNNDLWAMEVDPVHRFQPNGDPLLAWYATPNEMTLTGDWQTAKRSMPDHRVWEKLSTSTLLSDEARNNFADRVVIFADGVRDQETGGAVTPEKIQRNQRSIATYGYKFRVDRRMEIDVGLRRITPAGQNQFPIAPDFEFITNPDLVEVATGTVPFTGNYRETAVSIRPKKIVGGRADLQWAPQFRGDPPRDPRGDVGLRLPFSVERSWPWALFVAAIVFLLIGAAMVTVAINVNDFSAAARAALQAIGTGLIGTSIAFGTKLLDDLKRQS